MTEGVSGHHQSLPSAVRFLAASPVLAAFIFAGIGLLIWVILERLAAQFDAASPQPARDGMFVVLLALQIGYFVSMVPLLRRAGQQCVEQLSPLLQPSQPGLRELVDRFSVSPPLVFPQAVIVGAILAVSLQEAQFSRFSNWLALPDPALGEAFTVLLAWTAWSVGLSAVVTVVGDVSAMRRLGLKYVAVDLMRVEKLAPFSRYGLHLAGAVISLMVLWSVILVLITSLVGSTMTERTAYVGILMVITYIGLSVTLFVFPQLGIRARVRDEKARVMAHLTSLLPTSNQTIELAQSDPHRLAALLSTRADIQAISEWPAGQLARLRLVLYLLVLILPANSGHALKRLVVPQTLPG